jgi:L-idonate 5-dehydrogenase
MQAIQLSAPGTLTTIHRDIPVVTPRHALVRIDLVGLCGSDASYFARGANGDFVVAEPLVLGHEVIGTVTEIDAQPPGGPQVGDRVAVHPAWPSPRPGESAVAADLAGELPSFLGSASTRPHTDGGLQEYLSVRVERLRVLPQTLPTTTAVLAEPTAVVLHALANAGDVSGAEAFVCGAGPIGLLAALALRSAGAARVTVSDIRPAALQLAQALGADAIVDASLSPVPESSADIAIEASGVPAALANAIVVARPGGRIVQLGMLPRDPRPLSLSAFVTKELRLFGSHRFAGELDAAVQLLTATPLAAQIVTTVFPLAQAALAFEAVTDPAVVGKAAIAVSATVA